ncbi:MAG TPA: O-antigen ligase family protein [Pyrinomonadaceae bacterium]
MSLHQPTAARKSSHAVSPADAPQGFVAAFGERLALAGFALYAIFAPHSIAGAEIGLLLVGIALLLRVIMTRRAGFRRTVMDAPILLFAAWTILSALLSAEPRISLPKLQSVCVLFLFYLTQAFITRRTAALLVVLMITSGVAGALWSVFEIARGRGVVIAELAPDSPFRALPLGTGDAVWRVGSERISSVAEIDEVIRRSPAGAWLSVSAIKEGEHAEWKGFLLTDEIKARPQPSGIVGAGRSHRFRASGWTRHYETFSETLQILAQLALGLALANWQRRKTRWRMTLALLATGVLALGIALTAMRTVTLALALGAVVVGWRATRSSRRARLLVIAAIALMLATGAFMVWRTRASHALSLQDQSASLRLRVAEVGLSRVPLHPIFGHGMDALKNHWEDWGFPGTEVIHLHSTPLQIAFERGLPALLFWLWIVGQFWLLTARAEQQARNSSDANLHGLLLGATGAITGFFASSLVNYNFGDAEVALVFWWLMGIVIICQQAASSDGPTLTTDA